MMFRSASPALPVFAYAENGITPLGRGEVQDCERPVDQSTGHDQAEGQFPNEQYKLWPGDFVDCKIVVEKRRDGLTVPTAAIRQGPRGDYVWVVQARQYRRDPACAGAASARRHVGDRSPDWRQMKRSSLTATTAPGRKPRGNPSQRATEVGRESSRIE